jgi:hypothetical protein
VAVYHRVWLGTVHPLYPSGANVGFLLFPVAACVAMLVLPAGYPGGNWFRILLDGAIVAAALFVVSWVVVLRQAYAATGVKNSAAIVSLAYPVSEVVTVTVAVLVLARAHARWRLTVTLLTVGLTLIAASGGAYEYLFAHNNYDIDNPVGLGWSAGVVIVAIAALTCAPEPPFAPPEPPASLTAPQWLWLPYLPLAIAGGLELADFRSTANSDPAFVVVPWLVIAVLARQFLVVAENRRLAHSVSDHALRDPLTNLGNRVLFRDRLDHAIQLYHRDHEGRPTNHTRRGCRVPGSVAAPGIRDGAAAAVNLFPPLVGDINLPGHIFDALERHELPGDSLIVEITEDLLLDDIDRTRKVLEALREHSIQVALDDFGSGYSALTYLHKLPIDEVKVAYELIGHVLTDPRAEAIVRAVTDLSHALNVTTVAEGVENAETATWLRDRGCEVGQGILYSPPITAQAVMELLSSPAAR